MRLLLNLCALAALGFAVRVARLDRSYFEIPLLPECRDLPFVSIVVPARNEERTIERCVRSLLAQEWLDFELVVVDDRSTDATPAILARLAIEDERLRVVRGEQLPVDWVGKPWALDQGTKAARAQWLLFTDADATHAPRGVASALAFALERDVDALSIAPFQELGSIAEQAVLPSILGTIMLAVGSLTEVNDPMRPENALLNGQYILMKRDALGKLGGHAALHDKIGEDFELAKLIKNDGRYRMLLAPAPDLASVRMYHSFPEIWDGFTKNLALGAPNAVSFFAGLALLASISSVPLLLLARAARLRRPYDAAQALAILFCGIASAARGLPRLRQPRALALWYPLGMTALTAIGLNSGVRWYSGIGVEWRGRTYRRSNGG